MPTGYEFMAPLAELEASTRALQSTFPEGVVAVPDCGLSLSYTRYVRSVNVSIKSKTRECGKIICFSATVLATRHFARDLAWVIVAVLSSQTI